MRTRLFFALFLIALAVVLTIAVWPQLFGLQSSAVIAHIVSLRGVSFAAAVFFAILFFLVGMLLSRIRIFFASIATLLILFAGISGAILVERGLGNTSFVTKESNDITVLAWNTLGNATGAETIAQVAIEEEADVVSLPETTGAVATEVAVLMRNAGSPMWAHHVAFDNTAAARSTSILISPNLGEYEVVENKGNTEVLPTVIATPSDGSGPTIVGVHAVAPIAYEMANWREDLLWLSTLCRSESIIMAGDFNATVDHMAGLGMSDGTLGTCKDTAVSSGNGAVGTWNTAWPALLGSPIDHVMATPDWRVTGMKIRESEDEAGSDHRPVITQLSPTRSKTQ
jgi:endonuclease/exonuclease/phosphatase (EEP) superfamily protein YafD